jgi:signal transduction histidine kinase
VLAHAALTLEGDDDPPALPLGARIQLLEEEARRGGAEASQALRTWLSNVFASLPVGVCVVSPEGLPVWWNAAWPGLAGAATAEALQALSPDGERVVGNRTLLVTSATVVGDAALPGGRVVVLEDLTTRRTLEQTVAHQERLASIGRLGAGVAHEIGNPLAGLLMVAHNLEREDSPSDLKERLGAIVQQGHRIDEIVKALVTFARVERPERRQTRRVSLEQVVKDAVALVTMTRRRRFEVALEPQLSVTGIEGELMQVLVNLLSNASDASKDDSVVVITGQRLGDEVELTVGDTGVGMPAEVQARLFEPFFTTKEPGKGTGLGMSIVYSLVRAHGGRVSVESAVGRGTTILLRFPST